MNIQLRTGVASDATAIHNLITANLNAGHLLPRTFDDVESDRSSEGGGGGRWWTPWRR